MAPNIIGSTFILAESAIANNDANNNNNKATATDMVTPSTSTITEKPIVVNDRVPPQGNMASSVSVNTADARSTQKADTKTVAEATTIPYEMEIVWINVLLFIVLHSSALYGLYLVFAENAYLELSCLFIFAVIAGLGITAGVHRLWSHKAYKAKLPLRIFLMLAQSMAFQNSIWEWARDHRAHHKFTDTDADPHNSNRGFFFAHMGWLMCKKHGDLKKKSKVIDMTDLEADPVVMFQKRFYFFLMPILCFVIPALVPYYVFGSSLKVCFFTVSMLRYTLSLHFTWLVNSAAHFYGMKPYDITISATNTKLVSSLALGEGWHNYHHVFPWDYKAAELGTYQCNWSTAFIDYMAKIGQAYDLKSASPDIVLQRIKRTGDGTHISVIDQNNNNITEDMVAMLDHDKEETHIWGWDDKDVCDADRKGANISGKKDM